MKRALWMFGAAAMLCWSGCVESSDPKHQADLIPTPDTELHLVYAPLAHYNLELTCPGQKEFPSGQSAVLRFRLKNVDRDSIKIDEWYMADPNNIIVNFRPWHPDETPEQAAKADWYTIQPQFSPDLPPPERTPLLLHSGNMVFVDVRFPIIESIPKDKSTWFLVYGQLNLLSVDVTSKMFVVKAVKSDAAAESGAKEPETAGTPGAAPGAENTQP